MEKLLRKSSCESDDCDDSVFNEYEKEELELLANLYNYNSESKAERTLFD